MNGPNVLGVAAAVTVLLFLFEMMRRHRLREKYAIIWAVIAFVIVLLAVFPVILTEATDLLGLQVPTNLLFFGGSIAILVLTLQHSSELGRLEERTRSLAEELALLRLEAHRNDPASVEVAEEIANQAPDEDQDEA